MAKSTVYGIYSPDEDSLFITEYSSKLGVKLTRDCDQTLILTITDWIGTPYCRGGFSKSGIDCSGFVSKIYGEVYGIELTHSSASMISQMKQRVKKKDLQMGDILFFRIHGKRISHVGLYIGENRFIHASPSRGIVIDDLRQPYYERTYYTAGRVLDK